MLKLFFQKCTRDWYSDQFQCRLALPINQPSLISNIRAKPEPCNLQSLEIDQRIESSDGQSCKGRGDGPTHTHTHTKKTKNYRHQMRREKKRRPSPFAMRLGLGSSFYLFLLQKKKKKLEAASSTAHSFALLKDNELPVPMAFALAFFSSSFSSFVLNSMQPIHEIHK